MQTQHTAISGGVAIVVGFAAIMLLAILVIGCGGGGGGDDRGTLNVINRSSTRGSTECAIRVSVEAIDGSTVRTLTIGGCNSNALSLPPGEYNVIARGTTFCQGAFTETVNIVEGETTTERFGCDACGGCP